MVHRILCPVGFILHLATLASAVPLLIPALAQAQTEKWQYTGLYPIPYGIDVSADGRYVSAALTNGGLAAGMGVLLDAKTGKLLREFKGHKRGVSSVAISPDSKRLVTGSWDHTLRLWDTETGEELRTIDGHAWPVLSVAFSPDGKQILSSSDGFRLWDVESGKAVLEVPLFEGNKPVWSAEFTPDGKRALTGCGDGTVRLWDLSDGKQLQIYEDLGRIKCVTASPDGRYAAAATTDAPHVRVWDLHEEKLVHEYKGHTNGVSAVAFSPDSKQIAACGGQLIARQGLFHRLGPDRTIRVWDIETGDEQRKIDQHESYVTSLQFSPDGKGIISASGDSTVRWWKLAEN